MADTSVRVEHCYVAIPSSRLSAGPRRWAVPFGAAAALVVGLYFTVLNEAGRAIAYQGFGVTAVAAVVAGILWHRPTRPGGWWLLAGGFALFTLGDLVWLVYDLRGLEAPFPSVADVLYTAGYALMIAAVVTFSRHGRVGTFGGILDSLIVGGGLGLVLFVLVFEPAADVSGASDLSRTLAVGYPVADAFLLVAILQLYFAARARTPSTRALVAAVALLLIADVGYGNAALGGSYFSGDWVDAGWLVAYVLVAFAALHPSMRAFSGDRQRVGRLTYRRLVAVTVAVLAIPAMVILSPERSNPGAELYVIAGWGSVMIVLVFARMALLFAEHQQREAERVALEDRLRQSQKLEAVGKLAGGIAHDFNNLLLAVRGNADLARVDVAEPADVRGHLDAIVDAADKAASLTQQLLAFSRQQVLQPKVVDLNYVVTDAQVLLRRVIGTDVEIVVSLDPALPRVTADPGQLIQVLLNLAVNARDAMPRGGSLTLRTHRVVVDASDPDPLLAEQPGSYVSLTVADTGVGMDAATQARAFEPFFTSKPLGTGTGLGLATVYGIVQQTGGFVFLDSVPGLGTTVRILLPATEEAPVEPDAPEPRGAGGRERVVLVEDDDAVRALVSAMLEGDGYAVYSTADPFEAIERCRRVPCDLLVTDVVMPKLGGRAVAREVLAAAPGTQVLLISGYVDGNVDDVGFPFLQKPFSSEALSRTVRGLLDGRDALDMRESPVELDSQAG
jgi:two-component system cell cycle sensor histidine kinase/response regulator CckA